MSKVKKFLPFVKESTSPLSLYKTLVERGKGIPPFLLCGVFNTILEKGIDTVRDYVAVSGESTTKEVYTRLVEYFNCDLSYGYIKNVELLVPYILDEYWKTRTSGLEQFSIAEGLRFLAVLYLHQPVSNYTTFRFSCRDLSSSKGILSNLKDTGLFSDSGDPVVFTSKETLKGYILFHGSMDPNPPPPVTAVLSWNPDEKA